MSPYKAICRDATVDDAAHAAWCMWWQQEYPRKYWNSVNEYFDVVLPETVELPCMILMYGDIQVAWLTYIVSTDMHYPGLGAVVYHMVVDNRYPGALRALMKAFKDLADGVGCEWYQTTRRVNDTTYESKFKRLFN